MLWINNNNLSIKKSDSFFILHFFISAFEIFSFCILLKDKCFMCLLNIPGESKDTKTLLLPRQSMRAFFIIFLNLKESFVLFNFFWVDIKFSVLNSFGKYKVKCELTLLLLLGYFFLQQKIGRILLSSFGKEIPCFGTGVMLSTT